MTPESPDPADDRRRRHDTRYFLAGVIAVVENSPVRILNVSLGGVGLEGPQPLRVGKTYPVIISGHGEMLELSGTVRWCQVATDKNVANGEPATYDIGFRFEMRVEDLHALYAFLGAELAQQWI